jgi:cysteine-rich repeat protein
MRVWRSGLFSVIVLLATRGVATAWETRVDAPGGPGAAFAVAVDGDANVVAGGHLDDTNIRSAFTVVKLAGDDGTEMWRRVLHCDGDACEARGVAVDGSNDVLAVGHSNTPFNVPVFTVVKLARDTGAVLWHRDIVGGVATAVVVDSMDDPIAAGWTDDGTGQNFTVVKLRGTDGEEMWRATVPGGLAMRVLRTPLDDVVAAGLASGNTRVVVRLAGATGAELWRNAVPVENADHTTVFLALDRSSDDVAVASGAPGDAFTLPAGRVERLSGVDGTQQWTKSIGRPAGVAVRDSGDVVVADGVRDVGPRDVNLGDVFACARADGAELWRRSPGFGESNPVLDANGNVVAVTLVRNGNATPDGYIPPILAVTKLSGATGADVWSRTSNPIAAAPGGILPFATAVGPTGAVLAAGELIASPQSLWFVVLRFDGDDGSLDVCGDGAVDPGEQCDDGNRTSGDCCEATCQSVAADETPCQDANACITEDTKRCRAGSCVGTPVPCEPCGTCEPDLGCRAMPSVGCWSSRRALLDLRRAGPATERLTWRWESRLPGTKDDFGDPRATAAYALCIYSPPIAFTPTAPIVALVAPSGGTCGDVECWRATRRGFAYRDRRRPAEMPHGISQLTLGQDDAGTTRIDLHGVGDHLRLPRLPLSGAGVTVQLRRMDAPICWSADETLLRRNRRRRFTARDD